MTMHTAKPLRRMMRFFFERTDRQKLRRNRRELVHTAGCVVPGCDSVIDLQIIEHMRLCERLGVPPRIPRSLRHLVEEGKGVR